MASKTYNAPCTNNRSVNILTSKSSELNKKLIAKPWFIAIIVIIAGRNRTSAEVFTPLIRWDIHHEIHGGEVAGGREIRELWKHEGIEQVHESVVLEKA